jgi:hypothetical protein
MFTLFYVTVSHFNVVLRYVSVKLRYGMLCLVDLCTMNQFNRTEPMLLKLTLTCTLASVHGGSQQLCPTTAESVIDIFLLSTESRPVMGLPANPNTWVPNISNPPPKIKCRECEASHPRSARLKLIESVELFLNAHTLYCYTFVLFGVT